MQLKSTSAAVTVDTSSTANIEVHASWVDLVDAATTATPDDANVLISTATTTTIVPAPGSSTTCRRVKFISIRNSHGATSNTLTVKHNSGTVTVKMPDVSLAPGETLEYTEANGWNKKTWTSYRTTYSLASDAINSSVTPASVSGLLSDSLPAGNYVARYYIRYQTAATTTGIKFDLNFTGTVTSFVWNQYWVDSSALASTAAPSQNNNGAAGAVVGGFSSRAKGTAGRGVTLSTDAAGDMFMIVEALFTVTVAGQLDLYSGSEVAASNATVMAGSSLVISKTG